MCNRIVSCLSPVLVSLISISCVHCVRSLSSALSLPCALTSSLDSAGLSKPTAGIQEVDAEQAKVQKVSHLLSFTFCALCARDPRVSLCLSALVAVALCLRYAGDQRPQTNERILCSALHSSILQSLFLQSLPLYPSPPSPYPCYLQILQDPELRDLLMDAAFQAILVDCNDPVKYAMHMRNKETARKLKKLQAAGLVQVEL